MSWLRQHISTQLFVLFTVSEIHTYIPLHTHTHAQCEPFRPSKNVNCIKDGFQRTSQYTISKNLQDVKSRRQVQKEKGFIYT